MNQLCFIIHFFLTETTSFLSLCAFQVHLLNLFDNVNRVVFHEKNYDQILSFQSQEGETVDLSHPINAQVQYF